MSYHCAFRWLSLGKVLKTVQDLRDQFRISVLRKVMTSQNFRIKTGWADLGFAVHVTALINELNVKMQYKGLFAHEQYSVVETFMRKVQILSSQVKNNILTHLPTHTKSQKSRGSYQKVLNHVKSPACRIFKAILKFQNS